MNTTRLFVAHLKSCRERSTAFSYWPYHMKLTFPGILAAEEQEVRGAPPAADSFPCPLGIRARRDIPAGSSVGGRCAGPRNILRHPLRGQLHEGNNSTRLTVQGTVAWDFYGFFWFEWIYLGMNRNRFWFFSFKEIPSIWDSQSM